MQSPTAHRHRLLSSFVMMLRSRLQMKRTFAQYLPTAGKNILFLHLILKTVALMEILRR